jgi:ATP-dependent Lon protease
MNNHHMKTRSKSNKIKTYIYNDDSSSSDGEDEIDDYGNLTGFIDYNYDSPDENYKRKIKSNNSKNKKLKTDTNLDNPLGDIFLKYILQSANEKILNNDTSDDDTSDDDTSENFTKKDDIYDKKYKEYLDNNKNNENFELEYFKNLNKKDKKNILSEFEIINKYCEKDIPLKFKILSSHMDTNTKSIAISQINKCDDLDPSSSEYGKTTQWINELTKIPFDKFFKLPVNDNDSIDNKRKFLKNTNDILNDAIYGHNSAKSHILQVISKWIKNPDSGGNILAIQGPMGNGKTTLVKKGIAKAIGRPFHFIALGGASDSSYFDGHHYTYEGSKYGRIIEILIQSKCMNPIFYFDELDKVSDTQKGDEIIHLLTHLTDSSQNDRFQDNYFSGIDIDLSKALFIFSFNDENKIDRVLKDRMYVINTRGFKTHDKLNITKDYLLPELLKSYNYKDSIIFNDEIIQNIIENFTGNEEGVRNLKRCLETIISKVNMYELLYDCENDKSSIDLDYTIKEFSIPYNVKSDDLDILLNKNGVTDKPPEHMYV